MNTETLQRFCSAESDIRAYLHKPWRDGGFIYATNGHMLVEIPDDGREGIATKDQHPRAAEMFTKYPATEFVAFPALAPVSEESHKCPRCKGIGKHYSAPCDSCDGEGDFEHAGYTYECKRCEGEGATDDGDKLVTCWSCDGFGEDGSYNAHRTTIAGADFQTRYLRLFASLPGAQIAPNGDKSGAQVKFDGGRGVVMPMRP